MSRHPRLDGLLTPAQERVAVLVAQGYTDKQVSDELGVSVQTVKTHMKELRPRLGLGYHGRTSVAVFVITGWLPAGAACPTRCEKLVARERRLGAVA